MAFFAPSVRIFDLNGLATPEVARILKAGEPDRVVDALLRSPVTLTVYYTRHFPNLHLNWIPLWRWHIPNNVGALDSVATFFARNPREAEKLCRYVQRVHPPPRVRIEFLWRSCEP